MLIGLTFQPSSYFCKKGPETRKWRLDAKRRFFNGEMAAMARASSVRAAGSGMALSALVEPVPGEFVAPKFARQAS
jgi:hypothetical protein